MTGVGAALGWKYNNEPGICTRDDKLTAWPTKLGPPPTDAEIAAIMQDWLARKRTVDDLDPDQLTVLDRAIRADYLAAHPLLAQSLGL